LISLEEDKITRLKITSSREIKDIMLKQRYLREVRDNLFEIGQRYKIKTKIL